MDNYMKLEVVAIGRNEGFARSAVAAFALSLNPSLAELSDIKTAVSEAVTNCVVHAYKNKEDERKIVMECETETTQNGGVLHIRITDFGVGIDDVAQAVKPFYTTLANEERSGMGFTIMETFMDGFSLESEKGKGTTVYMRKQINGQASAFFAQDERDKAYGGKAEINVGR